MAYTCIFKLAANSVVGQDPIEEMRYNSMYGELLVKFRTTARVYKYECPEVVERKIVNLRSKKNYSQVIKIINALKQI